MTTITSLAYIKQYIRIRIEKGFYEKKNSLTKLMVKWGWLMALVVNSNLVSTCWPNGVVVHKAYYKKMSLAGFYKEVAPILCPNLIRGKTVDTIQV